MFEARMAELQRFFQWHPWVFLLLVPAATMSLWAEERRSGSIELLLTMPVTMTQAIIGKFAAAWIFMTIAILLTFPVVMTTSYLGKPDPGPIVGGYIGSILMAGAYVSIGVVTSSMTRSQVISFVISLLLCLLMLLAGWEPVVGFFVQWAPAVVVEWVASLSFMPHFESMQRGVIDLRDVGYYFAVIIFMLFAAHMVLENRKTA
jgi:ABC-2 type transport system permease protein